MMTASRHLGLALVCSSLSLVFAPDAAAQPPEPIGPFVVDARGVFVRFKDDPVLAQTLAVATADMPGSGAVEASVRYVSVEESGPMERPPKAGVSRRSKGVDPFCVAVEARTSC